jgi:hypothetical protein
LCGDAAEPRDGQDGPARIEMLDHVGERGDAPADPVHADERRESHVSRVSRAIPQLHDRRTRRLSFGCQSIRPPSAHAPREPGDRRLAEEVHEREIRTELTPDESGETDGEERVASLLEEVVVDAGVLHAKGLAPQPGDRPLEVGRAPRPRPPARVGSGSARRSSFPVAVAASRQYDDSVGIM